MKALIYSYSINFAKELGIELIPAGIESYKTSSKDDVFIILEKASDIGLLITENWEIDFLKKIREIRKEIIIFTLLTKVAEPEKFMELKEIGINSCISVSENIQEVYDELINSIIRHNIINTKEKRHFLRVTPAEMDNFQSAIFHKKKGDYIRGRVLNISMGGFAFLPLSDDSFSYLEVSRVYNPVFLSFHGNNIKTVSTLVAVRNGVYGFKFDNIENKDRKKLSTYIYEKLEENLNELLKSAT
ncbi:MAG: PilZ domain-containing protein [Brevinematia bacterium]